MTLSPRALQVLRAVHERPGSSRTEVARDVGIGSGAAADVVAGLVAGELLAERPAARTGVRGRPTTLLGPHEHGPVVLAAALMHETWRLQVVELGGAVVAEVDAEHVGAPSAEVVTAMARAATRLRRRFPQRVRAIGTSAPGTIDDTILVHASNPAWREVDLRGIWPRAGVFVVGNDATLAGAAESARGAAVGARVALHVRVEAGIGGSVVDHGHVLTGAHGLGGEFGHMPLGDPTVPCGCGAFGCWGTTVDGGALARLLGEPEPSDPAAYLRRMIAAGRHGASIERVAVALGRGVAGLVNAVDPDIVTLGGSGVDLLRAAPNRLEATYRAGLMQVRRPGAPPLLAAALGDDGPLVGAAEMAWTAVWDSL